MSNNEEMGFSVSKAGDFNTDGIDDVIIGTRGKAIIIFGSTSPFLPVYTSNIIDGVNGIILEDAIPGTHFGMNASYAGDVNNDGVTDVMVGAPNANVSGSNREGKAYVFFGNSSVSSMNVSSLNGTNGFGIDGFEQANTGLNDVGYIGDVNNDGFDDIGLSFTSYDSSTTADVGSLAVIYGASSFPTTISLSSLSAVNGFYIEGVNQYDYLGERFSSAGDFNNDGIDDILVTVRGDDDNNHAYIIFGRNVNFPLSFTINDLPTASRIAFKGNDNSGYYDVDALYDMNSDGIDDVVISTTIGGPASGGTVYVIYGTATPPSSLTEYEINGTDGFQIFIDNRYDSHGFGFSVSGIGDFNNDGNNDFIVGERASSTYYNYTGNVRVFFGKTINSSDTENPTIVCPSGIELYAGSHLPNYTPFLNGIDDNCTYQTDLTFTQSPAEGTIITSDTDVTITVTDRAGNSNFCTFTVTIKTDAAEIIDCSTTFILVNDLDGSNGFTIYGEKALSAAGYSVSEAGDINNDGIDDFIIGAPGAYEAFSGPYNAHRITIPGGAYVVYGTSSGFPPNILLSQLDGTDGFAIRNDTVGTNFPRTGRAVKSAGDLNGDGIDDIIISDPYRHSTYGREIGHNYIIFGNSSGFGSEFNLSTLNGSNGFAFIGNTDFENIGYDTDNLGDINGDGITDIGLITAGSGGGDGKCIVIYGSSSGFPAVMRPDDINGTNGFTIEGETGDEIGRFVVGLGDVNGDGNPDIGIGGDDEEMFVVYGRGSSFPSTFSISGLDGTNGFSIENSATPINSYYGLKKAGDLNNDGIDDIAITKEYILFGTNNMPAVMDLSTLDGTNGFHITNSGFGGAYNHVGDFNHDGIDDYMFRTLSNRYFLLYGKDNWTATVSLPSLSSVDGLYIYDHRNTYENSVSYAGDVNGDGIDDIVMGSSFNDGGNANIRVNADPGFVYVVFGKEITDTEAPEITCPDNQVLSAGEVLPDYTTHVDIIVSDNCTPEEDIVITQSPVMGSAYTPGMTVTLTATDVSGNIADCTFIVDETPDTEAPEITCPGNQELAAGNVLPDYTVHEDVVISDNSTEENDIVITQDPAPGTAFTPGMTVTLTATDVSGNESDCTFVVNALADTEAPEITCPGTQELAAGNVLPDYTVHEDVVISDNSTEENDIVITQDPAPGTAFTPGMTVTLTATDVSGNESDCTFVVNALADTEAPEITCPGTQELAAGNVLPDYTVHEDVAVSDNSTEENDIVITQDPAPGTAFTSGMIITLTATDASGNESDCTFVVNASTDTEASEITCPGNQELAVGNVLPDYTAHEDVAVSDNSTEVNDIVITQDPAPGTAFTPGMTITLTATDTSGNENDCTFIVNEIPVTGIPDTEAPVITCPGNQEVPCGTLVVADYTSMAVVIDNEDPSPDVIQDPAPGSPFTPSMVIMLIGIDESGNNNECTFTVNVDGLTSVDAGEDVTITEGNEVTLNANSNQGGTYQWSPDNDLNNTSIANPVANPRQTTTYTVTFVSNDGCTASDEVTVFVNELPEDETKYGLSPNNDGLYDFWEIKGIEAYPDNKVQIYNRWGDVVFETEGYDNVSNFFDGRANRLTALGAGDLPNGTYFFKIHINEQHLLRKTEGYIVLKR